MRRNPAAKSVERSIRMTRSLKELEEYVEWYKEEVKRWGKSKEQIAAHMLVLRSEMLAIALDEAKKRKRAKATKVRAADRARAKKALMKKAGKSKAKKNGWQQSASGIWMPTAQRNTGSRHDVRSSIPSFLDALDEEDDSENCESCAGKGKECKPCRGTGLKWDFALAPGEDLFSKAKKNPSQAERVSRLLKEMAQKLSEIEPHGKNVGLSDIERVRRGLQKRKKNKKSRRLAKLNPRSCNDCRKAKKLIVSDSGLACCQTCWDRREGVLPKRGQRVPAAVKAYKRRAKRNGRNV